MEKYNYFEAICADVREYINDNGITVTTSTRNEIEEQLNDALFINDSVTGNASGSYYCNTWKAAEAVAHNWDLLAEALDEFGCQGENIAEKGEEWADVTIRCYLLGQCIAAVLDEIETDDPEEDDEDDANK